MDRTTIEAKHTELQGYLTTQRTQRDLLREQLSAAEINCHQLEGAIAVCQQLLGGAPVQQSSVPSIPGPPPDNGKADA